MPGPAFLRGERVRLRPLEEEDLPFVRDALNDPSVWRSVGGQHTPTNLAMERRFFEDDIRREDLVQFLVTDGPNPVGMVELDPVEWDRSRATVAFWIGAVHQSEGFGREAVEVLARYAFSDLGLHKLSAEVFATNEASMALLESLGFVEEGRLREEEYVGGEWIDVVRYGLLAEEWTAW